MKPDDDDFYVSLDYLLEHFDFDGEEIRRELAAGRLAATWSKRGKNLNDRGKPIPAKEFGIRFSTILAWLANPATPPHLVEKIRQVVQKRLN